MSPADGRDEFDRGYLTAQVEELARAVKELREDVKSILAWRAWIMGAAAVVSGAVSMVFTWLKPH